MKIIFAALKHDYGIPGRGLSFEYYNFFDTLVHMGHDVTYFDFFEHYRRVGSAAMTALLRQEVDRLRPDLLFTFLFSDEFDPAQLKRIATETPTITMNWFADDHWRFDDFTHRWASCFTFSATTDAASVPKYHAIGCANVLLTQWGANPAVYKKGSGELRYDVSFVGQAHGDRPEVIRYLRRKGIPVVTKGTYWNVQRWHHYARRLHLMSERRFEAIAKDTRVSQEDMVATIQLSRFNLNLAASSQRGQEQIKGRNFEIPACGGFQLSGYADRLEEFFEPEKEIVLFHSPDELVEKIRYYRTHEAERITIAEAGYRRVMRDHTYERRFTDLFRQMGLA